MTDISRLLEPKLLHWTTVEETRFTIYCADCETHLMMGDVALWASPPDGVDNPGNLRAPLCKKCERDWAFEMTGNPDFLFPP